MSPASRLLKLLGLLEVRRDWSAGELSARLEVDPRTVRRDIERLRELGYPIDSTRGTGGGYRLRAGGKLPPLLFDDEEAVAIAVALRSAATGSITGIEESSVSALAKLERVLPSRLRRRVSALAHSTVVLPSAGDPIDAQLLIVLAAAVRDREGLVVRYRARNGALSRRHIEPHRLVSTGRRWYLLAFDGDRDAWRTLRIDRIEGMPMADRRFAPRPLPDADVGAYVSRAIAQSPYPHRASLVVRAPAELIRTRVAPTSATITALDESTCRFETGAHSLEQLTLYLGLLGAPFAVEEPPELREHLARLSEWFASAAAS